MLQMLKPNYERPGGLIADPKMGDRIGVSWAVAGMATGAATVLYVNDQLGAPHRNGVSQIQQLEGAIVSISANDQHAQTEMINGSMNALRQHKQNMKREAKTMVQITDLSKNLPSMPFGTGIPEGIGMAVLPVALAVVGAQRARLAIRAQQARETKSRRSGRSVKT